MSLQFYHYQGIAEHLQDEFDDYLTQNEKSDNEINRGKFYRSIGEGNKTKYYRYEDYLKVTSRKHSNRSLSKFESDCVDIKRIPSYRISLKRKRDEKIEPSHQRRSKKADIGLNKLCGVNVEDNYCVFSPSRAFPFGFSFNAVFYPSAYIQLTGENSESPFFWYFSENCEAIRKLKLEEPEQCHVTSIDFEQFGSENDVYIVSRGLYFPRLGKNLDLKHISTNSFRVVEFLVEGNFYNHCVAGSTTIGQRVKVFFHEYEHEYYEGTIEAIGKFGFRSIRVQWDEVDIELNEQEKEVQNLLSPWRIANFEISFKSIRSYMHFTKFRPCSGNRRVESSFSYHFASERLKECRRELAFYEVTHKQHHRTTVDIVIMKCENLAYVNYISLFFELKYILKNGLQLAVEEQSANMIENYLDFAKVIKEIDRQFLAVNWKSDEHSYVKDEGDDQADGDFMLGEDFQGNAETKLETRNLGVDLTYGRCLDLLSNVLFFMGKRIEVVDREVLLDLFENGTSSPKGKDEVLRFTRFTRSLRDVIHRSYTRMLPLCGFKEYKLLNVPKRFYLGFFSECEKGLTPKGCSADPNLTFEMTELTWRSSLRINAPHNKKGLYEYKDVKIVGMWSFGGIMKMRISYRVVDGSGNEVTKKIAQRSNTKDKKDVDGAKKALQKAVEDSDVPPLPVVPPPPPAVVFDMNMVLGTNLQEFDELVSEVDDQ